MASTIRSRTYKKQNGILSEKWLDSLIKNKNKDIYSNKTNIINTTMNMNRRLHNIYKRIKSKPKKIIHLTNRHFINGTVIIAPSYYIITDPENTSQTIKIEEDTTDYIFRLTENITFDPNRPPENPTEDDVWNASSVNNSQYLQNGGHYEPAAYGLGFFTAISIFASNVVLDLNGFTIQQGDSHFLLQRFFAMIELADQPFIPSQGPHSFGATLEYATNVMIVNGTIGKNSHHGIHGNLCNGILLKDLTFQNYEVAAIHLNGVENVSMVNITGENSCNDCPVLGIFSASRFLRPYIDKCVELGTGVTIAGNVVSAIDIKQSLKTAMYNVYRDVVINKNTTGGFILPTTNTLKEWSLFNNPSRMIDGNPYGIAINAIGVAVDGFPTSPTSVSSVIYCDNIVINNHIGDVHEIPALPSSSLTGANDPVGAVFQTQNIDASNNLITINSNGEYVGNVVSNAQALVAKAIIDNYNFGFLSTSRNSIDQSIINFVFGDKTLHTVEENGEAFGSYIYNVDTMKHVDKGVIGFKMDAGNILYMNNCKCMNICNKGLRGYTQETLPVSVSTTKDYQSYYNETGKSFPKATYNGYGGANTRGISLCSTTNACIDNIVIDGIYSNHGYSYGIDIHQTAKIIYVDNVTISGVFSANMNDEQITLWENNPTPYPYSIGIHIGDKTQDIYIDRKVSIRNLHAKREEINMTNVRIPLVFSGNYLEDI